MDKYEELAGSLEKRITALEDKVNKQQNGTGGTSGKTVNMLNYVDDLRKIRESLVTAKAEIDQITIDKNEAQKLVKEQQQVVDKLRYQVNILKKSVREGDDKLMGAQ
eukprot:TRINITY_DN19070_c1_g1_i4.p1 TRINITY_DN19070_c1_g1~~TRINITY_DN19070_c1_g1_i4.p1  ORF type:complete len:107 (-),score=25.75 TRINITY_DN19070_c1_g1_i4:285-605(-)